MEKYNYSDVVPAKPIGDVTIAEESLARMRFYVTEHPTAKYAAFQSHAMDRSDYGHVQFLAVGPEQTYQCVRAVRMPDFPNAVNWAYQFIGFVDLEKGVIVSFPEGEIHGKIN